VVQISYQGGNPDENGIGYKMPLSNFLQFGALLGHQRKIGIP